VSAAESSATAATEFAYVFVAATARSGPACNGSTQSAVRARSDLGSFVIASVGRPWRRASASTATTSGEAPDCEIAIAKAPASRGGAA
jgi:hypothetical protein